MWKKKEKTWSFSFRSLRLNSLSPSKLTGLLTFASFRQEQKCSKIWPLPLLVSFPNEPVIYSKHCYDLVIFHSSAIWERHCSTLTSYSVNGSPEMYRNPICRVNNFSGLWPNTGYSLTIDTSPCLLSVQSCLRLVKTAKLANNIAQHSQMEVWTILSLCAEVASLLLWCVCACQTISWLLSTCKEFLVCFLECCTNLSPKTKLCVLQFDAPDDLYAEWGKTENIFVEEGLDMESEECLPLAYQYCQACCSLTG